MSDELTQFLSQSEWCLRFDDEHLAWGKKISSPRFLKKLTLTSAEDGFRIEATVDDCNCEIDLWPEGGDRWDFDTSCECDFGSFCPHAAGALFRASRPNTLARLLRDPSPAKPKPEVIPPEEIAVGCEPTFQLQIASEPADHRVIQLLLQALKAPERDHWLVARPSVSYGAQNFPLGKSTNQSGAGRDKPSEFRALEFLKTLGLTDLGGHPSYRFLLSLAAKQDGEQSLSGNWFPDPDLGSAATYWPWFRAQAVPKLENAGWKVLIADDFGHQVYQLNEHALEASLTPSHGGWFSLSVGIDLEGEKLDLLPILSGLLTGDTLAQLHELDDQETHLVYLPRGGALQIPVGRLRKILNHLAAFTDPKAPAVHPLDAAALVEEEIFPISPPPELNVLRKKLADRKGSRSFQQPKGLQANLRDYQKTGVEWMSFLSDHELHGILADDMGLGKTLQTLTHILGTKSDKPALVVAPTSVVPNWAAESKKFTPELKVLTLHGPSRHQFFQQIPQADLVLTSFALLQRDVDKLKEFTFEMIILDEAQHIKNPSAKVSKAACELKGRQRLCLSGTPVENNLGELWSLFRFLIPGFLGPLKNFRSQYQHPIERDQDESRAEALRARLGPLILRRTKDEVATELPPKTHLVHHVDLSSQQRDLYETVRATMDKDVRAAIAARGLDESQFAILAALLKLRQICCHPQLLELPGKMDPTPNSAKLEYLFELLETLFAEGRRVLLFSQFTSMLDLISRELELRKISYMILTGESKDRGELVSTFQNGTTPIFLISLKAGGTGLNLTAADTVIHYDPWWNPAVENQATDRAYRIGQVNPVFVHKLICRGTVEDRIHELQQKKGHLADSLLSGAASSVPTGSELQNLLKPL